MGIIVFCLILTLLFFISRMVTRALSQLFLRLFHKPAAAIYVLSFLFLPGVILHELAHLFMASILLVPTGEIEFFPEVRGNEVKMGSVAIGQTDPVRRFLIGIAPLLGGVGVLLLLAVFLFGGAQLWKDVLMFYVVFEVGNTMFSSRKDMEGAVELLAGLFLLVLILQILGISFIPFFQKQLASSAVNIFFFHVGALLAIALGIDIGMLLLAKGLLAIRSRVY